MRRLGFLLTFAGIVAAWQGLVSVTGVAPYILPGPLAVGRALVLHAGALLGHAATTAAEIALGLGLGTGLGFASAVAIGYLRPARRWLMPLLVVSQAVPVFAIAPLLVLWLGYGMVSKVAMATLIIYFPIATSFIDGLRRTEPGWLDLARTMTAGRPGAAWACFRHIRIHAGLPALASGVRLGAAIAPIGAIIGEWVGSNAGLGYLMLHANARMKVDLMFAALAVLAVLAVALFVAVDATCRRLLHWLPEGLPTEARTDWEEQR
ncbi:MAG: ABC transporter permease [Alphaproteobacteria bacterium]|nr:ABC transporter permease [Alphaproteobacteria bacterium]